MSSLLVATIFVPLIGAVLVWALAPLGQAAVRSVALLVAVVALLLAGRLLWNFPPDGAGEFAVSSVAWLSVEQGAPFDVRWNVGLDGLGIWMFGLSALLIIPCVLVSWNAITDRPALFYAMLLLLEFGCLGVFAARDIILFYVFFEFTLIPLFFLIGIWGSEQRRHAAVKFFLFTLAGSLLTFLGLVAIVLWDAQHNGASAVHFSIPDLVAGLRLHPLPANLQLLIFLALFAGFAIKVPLFPLHTWLPLAHVQAPTAGSVILAGILLKIGVYGFLRFSIPLLPDASVACMPWILALAAAGIVYGALVALAQQDMKRLIAYSSVSHLGYCLLGLFAFNPAGVQGGVLQMVNHGISTGALFALVGMLYERYHTREIAQLGGLARRLPWLAFFFVVFTFSSIGLPGLNGFPGEFLVLLGMFQRAWVNSGPLHASLLVISLAALSGVVLGAWYMLYLVQRVLFGPLKEPPAEHAVEDLSWREILALAPLALLALWIGLRPNDFLRPMQPALSAAVAGVDEPLQTLLRGDEPVAGSPAASAEEVADVR